MSVKVLDTIIYLNPYYEELISAYNEKRFKYLFEELETSKHISLISENLIRFFIIQLQNRKSNNVNTTFRAIHSLISNPFSQPRVIYQIIEHEKLLIQLFIDNSDIFSFPTKDILYKIFHKVPVEYWLPKFLKLLYDMCQKHFKNFSSHPSVYYNIISCLLEIGIEAIPIKFYPFLKHFLNHMLNNSSSLSSNAAMSKTWDQLLLFCRHWVMYALCYPFKNNLDPSKSFIKFKDYVYPDLSILENEYIRDKLKYEFIHVENDYEPCNLLQPSLLNLHLAFLDDPNMTLKMKDKRKKDEIDKEDVSYHKMGDKNNKKKDALYHKMEDKIDANPISKKLRPDFEDEIDKAVKIDDKEVKIVYPTLKFFGLEGEFYDIEDEYDDKEVEIDDIEDEYEVKEVEIDDFEDEYDDKEVEIDDIEDEVCDTGDKFDVIEDETDDSEDEILEIGECFCEECKQYGKCSCVEDYLEAYARKQQNSSESTMEINENEIPSSSGQNKSTYFVKTQLRFDPSDDSDKDIINENSREYYQNYVHVCSYPTIKLSEKMGHSVQTSD